MQCRKCKKDIPEDSAFCNHCGAKQNLVRKPKQKGNGLGSVYQLPNKTWRAEITLGYDMTGGVLKRKAKTKSGFRTKKSAEEYLPLLFAQPASVKKATSFKGLYEQWLPRHEIKVSRSTMDCYKAAYKYFALVHYVDFSTLKTGELQRCIDACPRGTRTKENMKALGTLLYAYALENDIVEKNYATFLYIKKESSKKREFFSLKERAKLWKHVESVKNIEYVLCLMYTGFRPNELLSLKKSDYYGDYFIGGSKTAKGINRIVTISPKIKPLIDLLMSSCRSSNDYLFSPSEKKLGDKKFYNMYYKVLEDCGISKKEPYCCRHTFATLMKEVDAPATDKMALIGHTSMEMTAHYTHADIDSLKKITDRID